MLRFSRFKADSNKLIHQIIKPANFKSKFPMNYLIKKNFCIKGTNKISERLSFLNTEEDMRKYFNIVDHDKKDADIIFNEELKTQQEIFLETQKEFDSFDRKKLLEFINKFRSELQTNEKEDSQKNNFEIENEYSLPIERVFILKDFFIINAY